MPQTTVQLDDELTALLDCAGQPVEDAAKEMIVLELYRRHTISSGRAAELLAMDRFDFIRRASDLGIPFFEMSEEELRMDLETLKKLR